MCVGVREGCVRARASRRVVGSSEVVRRKSSVVPSHAKCRGRASKRGVVQGARCALRVVRVAYGVRASSAKCRAGVRSRARLGDRASVQT